MIFQKLHQHGVSTRNYLLVFALVVVLPILSFAVFVLNQFAADERAQAERAALDLATHISRLVEAEHERLASKLDGLKASSSLRRGDLFTFHDEARHAVGGTDQIIVLRDLRGNQILNTQVEFGAPLLPAVPVTQEVVAALQDGKRIVSGVYSNPVSKEHRVALAQPVEFRGDLHALAITISTTRVFELLRAATPPNWTVGIADAAGIYVTHSSLNDEWAGRPAHAAYVARAVGESGSFIGTDRFGTPLLVGYVRQPSSGWLVGANIEHGRVLAPYHRLLGLFAAFGTLALATSLGAAWYLGARYAKSAAQLAGQVNALREGQATTLEHTPIRELAQIGVALTAVGLAIKVREQERERAVQRDALLGSVFEAAGLHVGILEDEATGLRLLAGNRAAAEAAGIESEVREPRRMNSEGAPEEWRRHANKALELGERLEAEYEAAGKWFVGVFTPLADHPNSRKVAFTALDVTARQVAQREADRRGRELALVLSTVPAGVWFTYDRDAGDATRNAYAKRVMRDARVLVSSGSERLPPEGTVQFHKGGKPLSAAEMPLRAAMLGAPTEDQEYELRFSSGDSTFILMSASPLRDMNGDVAGAVAVAIDITERKRAEEQRQLLTNELTHRVKNMLASVQSLASNTLRSATSIDQARVVLADRLIALAKAHDILTHESWEGAVLDDVLRAALGAQFGTARFTASGPKVWLEPALTLAFTMTVHELTTNAIKYGALSNEAGRIEISWTVEDTTLVFVWRETGGPAVPPPTRRGFGSQLIERSFGGSGAAIIDFHAEGLACRITVQLAGSKEGPDRSG